jgi:hypothetical protein
MTVRELIAHLQDIDGNLPVTIVTGLRTDDDEPYCLEDREELTELSCVYCGETPTFPESLVIECIRTSNQDAAAESWSYDIDAMFAAHN